MLTFAESEVALRNACVGAESARDVIIIDGPEAASYLHGQMSQNIEGLAEGSSTWTFLLEPTGRITAWGRVTRVASEVYWFDVDEGTGKDALARLERFKLRTKAVFSAHWSVPTFSVRGPAMPARSQLQEAVASIEPARTPSILASDMPWSTSPGVDLIGLEILPDVGLNNGASQLKGLGVALGDAAVIELDRVEAGRPAMGAEIGEKTIPAETGVVGQSADFTKGCYVGQELVARVDSRGNNTPRTVHPIKMATTTVPMPGSELVLDGAVVGTITSAAASSDRVVALASIKRGVEVPVTVEVDVDGQMVAAEVSAVHWG